MTQSEPAIRLPRPRFARTLGLGGLLLLGGFAFIGPSGIMAWNENVHLLEHRKAELERLEAERDELKNRVALLNPDHADPDLVGELLRSKLNVAHPDEVVVDLH